MGRLIDVTVPLAADLPTYPGDPPFQCRPTHTIEGGEPYNVSRLALGTHAGTHVDAPLHFIPGAPAVDALRLEALVGLARVVDAGDAASVGVEMLGGWDLEGVSRLLVKTRNSGQLRPGTPFREDFVWLDPDAARELARRGLLLLAWDYLSIEQFGRSDFAAHHALLGAGVVVVEGVDLSGVEPGDYRVACLPLRVAGADGAPARVLLEAP
jgi:arylformamidase